MAIRVKKSTGSRHIDPGEYVAVVDSIREGKGNYGTYFIWAFIVDNPMEDEEEIDEEVRVTGITSDILSPKSKLGKWCMAAGIDLESEDEEIDIEEAIGEIVRIIVEDDESDDGNVYSKVKLVLKAKKKKKKEPEPEEDDAADDEEEEEKPKKKAKKKAAKKSEKKSKKKSKPKDEDEDDDEDEAPPDDGDDDDEDDDLFNFDDEDEDED